MKIEATVRFGKTKVVHTWEYINASGSHYLVIVRLKNDTPLVIRMEPSQIKLPEKKIDEVYLGELNAVDAFLLKSA